MRMFKKSNEKGAIIVFFAFLIPLIMLSFALAIDLGNLYSHKTRLQNAADAAALAGARAYANNNEALDYHPKADAEAELYAEQNAEKNNLKNGITLSPAPRAKADTDENIYYRVDLTETVPLHFLRIIGITEQEVKADSVANIVANVSYEKDKRGGKDLFIFRHKLKSVNTISNPDNFDIKGQIITTFDGNVAFTDGSGKNNKNASKYEYDNLSISAQTDKLQYFPTAKAKAEGMSVNEAVATLKDEDEGNNEYVSRVIFEDYDMDELGITTKALFDMETDAKTKSQLNGAINSEDLSSNLAVVAQNGDGNIDVNIDSVVPGSTSDSNPNPVYLYLDPSLYMVNVNVTASNNRPVILVYEGTGKLHINLNGGSTFSGVIYAPNVTDYDNCLINNNNSTFEGSIIANYIDLQGAGGAYKYKDFGVGNTNVTTGAVVTKIDSSSVIKLTTTGSGVSWE